MRLLLDVSLGLQRYHPPQNQIVSLHGLQHERPLYCDERHYSLRASWEEARLARVSWIRYRIRTGSVHTHRHHTQQRGSSSPLPWKGGGGVIRAAEYAGWSWGSTMLQQPRLAAAAGAAVPQPGSSRGVKKTKNAVREALVAARRALRAHPPAQSPRDSECKSPRRWRQ